MDHGGYVDEFGIPLTQQKTPVPSIQTSTHGQGLASSSQQYAVDMRQPSAPGFNVAYPSAPQSVQSIPVQQQQQFVQSATIQQQQPSPVQYGMRQSVPAILTQQNAMQVQGQIAFASPAAMPMQPIQMIQQPDGSVLMLAPTLVPMQTPAPSVRRKTVKDLKLTGGNLVIDCPVPDRLLNNIGKTDSEEFTTMRYTAVTCDPDDFGASKYTIRPAMYGRKTELFIVMTMYNEVCFLLLPGC
jgi:hypothetical protein